MFPVEFSYISMNDGACVQNAVTASNFDHIHGIEKPVVFCGMFSYM